MKPQACKIHLPGNHACPYPALYQVTWKPHRVGGFRGSIHRLVCVAHFTRAIDQALDDSAANADVRVRIVAHVPQDLSP